jgi:flavin-dependent dehydrogenase
MASTTRSHVDVFVIGAGPAGLMCTLALARAGVNVRVIDKRSTKILVGQASGIQPRTIEVLQVRLHCWRSTCTQLNLAELWASGEILAPSVENEHGGARLFWRKQSSRL